MMKTLIQRAFLLISVIMFLCNKIQSQENASLPDFFLETKPPKLHKIDFANKYEIDYEVIKKFFPVKVNPDKLLNENYLSIKINNDIIKIKKDKLIKHGLSSYGFFGRSEGKEFNNVIITLRRNNIIGSIFMDSISYSIATFKDNEYYLMEIVDKTAKLGDDYIYEEIVENGNNGNVQVSNKLSASVNTENMQDLIASTMATNSVNACNMRILVLYTPAAEAAMSDIQNSIQFIINQSNQYMVNSNVSETWELAYSGLTDYEETPGNGRYTDLYNFRADTDIFMNEVHDLREKYSADVCVLISKCMDQGNCGGCSFVNV